MRAPPRARHASECALASLTNRAGAPHPTRRFLRARRFDPQKAMKQFADSEAWRRKHNVDALYATFPPDEFENARRFYPRWTGRRDRVRPPHACSCSGINRPPRACFTLGLPLR